MQELAHRREKPLSTYKMNGHTMEQVTEEKDLGILIDNELKFHIQQWLLKKQIEY